MVKSKKAPVAEPEIPSEIVLEGRTFRLRDDLTAEQEFYMLDVTDTMGLDDLDPTVFLEGAPEEQLRAGKQLVVKAYRSGSLFKMMSGMLIEEGVEWDPEVAAENANFFRNLKDAESKRVFERTIVFALFTFFASGLLSTKTFLSSSSQIKVTPKARSQGEEASSSVNGSPSSVKLLVETLEKSGKLRVGRSGKRSSSTSTS